MSQPAPTSEALVAEFRRQINFHLDESARKVEAAWATLSEEEVWQRPNPQTLAPGNQLLHLAGNLRQWVGTHLAGLPAVRARDAEFAARGGLGKAEVYARYAEALAVARRRLAQPLDLLRAVTVQGHATTELGVWVHVTEHLSYHTGQLVFFAKQLRGREFDFYGDWELG